MRCLPSLLAAVMVVGLAACTGGNDDSSTTTSSTSSSSSSSSSTSESSSSSSTSEESSGGGSSPLSYQVPNTDCPSDYPYGLLVTTDVPSEVQYLDKVPACTNADSTYTWVRNKSDAVWLINTTTPGSAQRLQDDVTTDLAEAAFMDAVRPPTAILVPGTSRLVNLPPEQVQWEVSLEYSFGWEAQDFTLSRIESAASGGAVAALRRRGSPAGAAVAACALAGYEGVRGAKGLADADAQQVIIDVLGTSAAGLKCRTEAQDVSTVHAGSPGVLSEELTHLGSQTELLENVHLRLDNAQRLSKAVNLLKFLPRG